MKHKEELAKIRAGIDALDQKAVKLLNTRLKLAQRIGELKRGSRTRIYVAERTLAAPRTSVWTAFADPATWRHWWPGVSSASYGNSPEPYGVGTFREATVSGQRYEEYIVAWEEQRRFAY